MSGLQFNPLLGGRQLQPPRQPFQQPLRQPFQQPLQPFQQPIQSPIRPLGLRPSRPSQVTVEKCKSSTFNYVTGLALLTLLLGIIAGILIQYWTSKSDCLSMGQFGSAIFYSFIAALIVGIITFVSHRIYCNSK